MIDSLSNPIVVQKITDAALALEQYRQLHPENVSTPRRFLRALAEERKFDQLRDRYWSLWFANNPHVGVPYSMRAPLSKDPVARKLRHKRKAEMVFIENLLRESGEILRQGKTYTSIFGAPIPVQSVSA